MHYFKKLNFPAKIRIFFEMLFFGNLKKIKIRKKSLKMNDYLDLEVTNKFEVIES